AKENIERAIKKGGGELDGAVYYELTYEGYAPGGVALIIDTLTDNKNRTAADVRSTLTKLGGSLGNPGSVSYMFETKGIISYDGEEYTEDQILEAALDLGAEDISTSSDIIEIITDPNDFASILEGMQTAGFTETSAEISKISDTTISLDHEKTRKVLRIIERLEDLDDVQQVSSNLEIPDDYNDEEE
ncbi:MAG: YebC/PmpR family DNA-binding transcriptional regulator, partial [Sphaerochaetaceae bacterium]|nr:YebC/PmpR family DNA-binding transcriptional regulator [Sphaerochaetaceae bacterium]